MTDLQTVAIAKCLYALGEVPAEERLATLAILIRFLMDFEWGSRESDNATKILKRTGLNS